MEERYLAYKPNNLSSVSAIHVKVKETENDANLFSCSGTGAPLHTLTMHTYTINNLFLKEETKGVGHSLMGSLVHSFNHFSQQIYMSNTNMLVGCCNKQKCQNVCLQGDLVPLGRQ